MTDTPTTPEKSSFLQQCLIHWKTTVAGLAVIAAATARSVFGVEIPGFESIDLGNALLIGLGLIFGLEIKTGKK